MPKAKKNKARVLHRITTIVFAKSIFKQLFCHFKNLINLVLCLVRQEPISIPNIIFRQSVFAACYDEGVTVLKGGNSMPIYVFKISLQKIDGNNPLSLKAND